MQRGAVFNCIVSLFLSWVSIGTFVSLVALLNMSSVFSGISCF